MAASSSHSSFDAAAARRLREALGMRPADVAHGMWAAYGLRTGPATVAGWEDGDGAPGPAELTALAGALWCAPAELLRSPRTLHEHRLARGLAAADVAMLIGMPAARYEEAERTGVWRGDDRQAATLGAALHLPPATLLELTGRSGRLAEALRDAVTTRWQAHAGRVATLVPLPRVRIEEALRGLHRDYQSTATGALSWTGGAAADGSAAQDFLAGVLARFWALADRP
jgi:transcriptional regulator with XRE-family HTH domain